MRLRPQLNDLEAPSTAAFFTIGAFGYGIPALVLIRWVPFFTNRWLVRRNHA